jgi:hypothetical protein
MAFNIFKESDPCFPFNAAAHKAFLYNCRNDGKHSDCMPTKGVGIKAGEIVVGKAGLCIAECDVIGIKPSDTTQFIPNCIATWFGHDMRCMVPNTSAYPWTQRWTKNQNVYYSVIEIPANLEGALRAKGINPVRGADGGLYFNVTPYNLNYNKPKIGRPQDDRRLISSIRVKPGITFDHTPDVHVTEDSVIGSPIRETMKQPVSKPEGGTGGLAAFMTGMTSAPTPSAHVEAPTSRNAVVRPHVEHADTNRIGRAGEEFVVRMEIARLIDLGVPDAKSKVEWTAKDLGDGYGYDIKSIEDLDGTPRYLEVKTTTGGINEPFFISPNEVRFSSENAPNYHLVRIFGYTTRDLQTFYTIDGDIATCGYTLLPTQFTVQI